MIVRNSFGEETKGGLKPLCCLMPAILFLFLLISPHNIHAASADKKILIVHQKTQGFSQQLIDHLQQNFTNNGYLTSKMKLEPNRKLEQLQLLKIKSQHLVISIGSQTTKTLLDENLHAPILSALIPRHIFNSLDSAHPKKNNWTSLLIDQPVERQFHLISAVLGEHKDIGVLLGPYTNDLLKKLTKSSSDNEHNIKTEAIESSDQLTPSIKVLTNSVDVLLTLPDPIVYNKGTIRGILLLAYRNRLPIIGFSQAYVKAGALAAIYSKPDQISKQILNITNNYFIHKSFGIKKNYPDDFSVALNKNIARSLGIKLKAEDKIVLQIKKAELK